MSSFIPFPNFTQSLDGWQQRKNPYTRLEFGKWELHLPANSDGSCPIKHGSKVKVWSAFYAISLAINFISLSFPFYRLWLKIIMEQCWIDCLHGQTMLSNLPQMKAVLTNKLCGIHQRYLFSWQCLILKNLDLLLRFRNTNSSTRAHQDQPALEFMNVMLELQLKKGK